MTFDAGETQIVRLKRAPVMGWMAVLSGLRLGRLEPIRLEGSILGREPNCDIQLDDDVVSGRHAKVWAQEPAEGDDHWTFFIQDMASTNGTYVNGKEILKETLKDGDVVELGKAKLVFKCIELQR